MRHTMRPTMLLALLLLATASLVSAQEIEEVEIIIPGPEEDLFVDPISDTLDPAKAYLRPADAEIEASRFNVTLGANELPAARAALRPNLLSPAREVFLEPADESREFATFESVTARGFRARRQALSRRTSYNELVQTRKSRFGRVERDRSPLAP